jgi:hypothetical protein
MNKVDRAVFYQRSLLKALCVRVIGPKSEASTNILSSAASVCVCVRRAMQLKSNPLNGKERETIE